MNPFEMVVVIVAIVTVGSIIRTRRGGRLMRRFEPMLGTLRDDEPVEDVEKQRLREEVQALKERVAVLERIATDRSSTLEQEIEQLRDR